MLLLLCRTRRYWKCDNFDYRVKITVFRILEQRNHHVCWYKKTNQKKMHMKMNTITNNDVWILNVINPSWDPGNCPIFILSFLSVFGFSARNDQECGFKGRTYFSPYGDSLRISKLQKHTCSFGVTSIRS